MYGCDCGIIFSKPAFLTSTLGRLPAEQQRQRRTQQASRGCGGFNTARSRRCRNGPVEVAAGSRTIGHRVGEFVHAYLTFSTLSRLRALPARHCSPAVRRRRRGWYALEPLPPPTTRSCRRCRGSASLPALAREHDAGHRRTHLARRSPVVPQPVSVFCQVRPRRATHALPLSPYPRITSARASSRRMCPCTASQTPRNASRAVETQHLARARAA